MLTNFANAFARLTKFSAATEIKPISIQGAKYEAISTGDGYFTIKDVMMFGEVPAGEKNAPKDIKAAEMQQMVDSATSKYDKEKFAAPAHLGHHKSIALKDPEFLGFMLPKRVGKTTLDGKEQDAVYGDVKVKASAFERIQKGELPYVSPEVDWEKMQFSSLAFLDSMPPHFRGPLITIGKVTEDSAAKFTVGATLSKGLFMALDSDQRDTQSDDKSAQMCSKCKSQMSSDYSFVVKPDSSAPKEDGMEKKDEKKEEVKAASFESDPAAVAKFAAQEARMKALEDRLAAKDAESAKKERVEAAFAEMKGRPLTDAGKAGIEKFADDPDKLKVFIEVLKAQTPENPPKTVAAFESGGKAVSVSGTDPDIAAFQAKGPEVMEAALKYAAQFENWKRSPLSRGAKLRDDRKAYIETMMELDPTAKAVKGVSMEGVR